jgi:hypothetical protein
MSGLILMGGGGGRACLGNVCFVKCSFFHVTGIACVLETNEQEELECFWEKARCEESA